jgi:hypothetical protein
MATMTVAAMHISEISHSLALCCVVWKKCKNRMSQEYVSNVSDMLQVLYIDVAKLYRDVAHVVMAIHVSFMCICSKCFICSKRMFQVFYLDVAKVDLDVAYTCMLQAYVSSVFRCLIRMLQVFYLDVVYVCNGFQMFFRHFRKCFRRLIQVFHLFSSVCCNCRI